MNTSAINFASKRKLGIILVFSSVGNGLVDINVKLGSPELLVLAFFGGLLVCFLSRVFRGLFMPTFNYESEVMKIPNIIKISLTLTCTGEMRIIKNRSTSKTPHISNANAMGVNEN